MPKPLEEQILEEEIRRLQRELAVLEGYGPELPTRIEDSEYLDHIPQNEGPEYLEVHASLWDKLIVAQGHNFSTLVKAENYAHTRGYKGIRVTFKRM